MAVLISQYGLPSSGAMGRIFSQMDEDNKKEIRVHPRLSASPKLFSNVSYQAGITHNRWSFDHTIGIAWGDYDNDSWVDLYVTDSGFPNTLYQNNGDGTFSPSALTDSVALADLESGGAIFVDYNNDGWKDLFVVGWGPNTLFENQDGQVFVDVTARAGLAGNVENSKSASWGDYDNDGFLDLYIANWSCYPRCGRPMAGESDRLYHNNGDGTFTDVTPLLGSKVEGAGFVASFTDFDSDGDLDIYLINDEFINPIGNALWRNDGPGCNGWCFSEISAAARADTRLMGMGIATSDYDNDGDLDYYFSNAGPMAFLQNQADGSFEEVAAQIGVDAPLRIGFGMIAFDYDNDAWQDLYLAVPAYIGGDDVPANPLFHNNGDGSFTRVCCDTGAADVGATLGVASADYNRDGWPDFLIGSFNQGYELYQNQAVAGAGNHWLTFELRGSGPVNADAVGTRIVLTTPDGLTQMQELQAGSSVGAGNELILHFGLGAAEKAAEIKVIWPDGLEQTFESVPADRRIVLPYPVDTVALQAQTANLFGADQPTSESVYVGVLILIVILMFIASRYVDSRVSGSAILLLAALTLAITACTAPSPDATLKALLEQAEAVIPEEMPTFEDNPELVALGEALFWDPILSGNRDIACATCHHPDFGTGDGIPLSVGTGATGLGPERSLGEGREFVPRNATEIFNRGLPGWTTMFWDRRVFAIEDGVHFGSPAAYRLPAGLENILAAQAMFPVLSRDEMRGDRGDLDVYGAPNEIAAINDKYVDEIWAAIMRRVLEIPDYVDLFANVFPAMPVDELGFQHAANAIAAYEAQTFTFLDSPFDRYLLGEEDALSEAARRGALLFYGEAGCAACHSGLLLTDQLPHNIGAPQLGPGKGVNDPLDPGVMLVSGEMDDRYSFRTPPLRNVALTAPYFHNGAYDDLADVILHHLDPAAALREYSGAHLPAALQSMVQRDAATQDAILAWLDPEIENLPSLSGEQIADLLVFLDALTSPTARDMSGLIPVSVPSGLPAGGALIP